MARRLVSFVHVADERGEVHAFGPDDRVPAWAAKLMGDHCWESKGDDSDDREEEPAEDPAEVGSEFTPDEDKPAEEKSPAARRRGTIH